MPKALKKATKKNTTNGKSKVTIKAEDQDSMSSGGSEPIELEGKKMIHAGGDDDMSFVSQDEEYGDDGDDLDDGQSDKSGASKYSGEEGVSVHDENTAKNFESEEAKEERRKSRRIEKLDKRIKLL